MSEEECTICDGSGYIDNPNYRNDKDEIGLVCPECGDDEYYNWEDQEWSENKLFYENDLEHLEELRQRERHPRKEKV